jgi:hypothetical protein
MSNKNIVSGSMDKSPILRVTVERTLERIRRIDDLQIATFSYGVNKNVHTLNADQIFFIHQLMHK